VNQRTPETPDQEFELAAEYTPSAFAGSNFSKKTRMGSTDNNGNRLSNMPGEGRPSLTSVTPYDDHADELVSKVEVVASKVRAPRKEKPINTQNENGCNVTNTLSVIKKENDKLMQTKKVVANEGK